MINLGLLGWPLLHSISPTLHSAALNSLSLTGEYNLYPIDPAGSVGIEYYLNQVRSGILSGLNVTIPYKKTVINFVDLITPTAKAIGAVNTIFLKDDQLIGDNTDAPGFYKDLVLKAGFDRSFQGNAIVLGSGGSARAVVWILSEMSWKVTIAARNISKSTQLEMDIEERCQKRKIQCVGLDSTSLATIIDKTNLIVNTTPLGMFPEVENSPWPAGLIFPPNAFVYDLIYNPQRTRLIESAEKAGLQSTNGLGMLVEQAALAFEIWTSRHVSREIMSAAASFEMKKFGANPSRSIQEVL